MVMVVSFSRSFIYVVKLWVLRFFVSLCSRGAKVGFAIWISYLNHNVAKISLLFSFLFFFFFCRVWEGYTLASFLQFLVPLFHGVYIFSCKYHLIGSMTFDSVIILFGFIQIGFVCFFPLFSSFVFLKDAGFSDCDSIFSYDGAKRRYSKNREEKLSPALHLASAAEAGALVSSCNLTIKMGELLFSFFCHPTWLLTFSYLNLFALA